MLCLSVRNFDRMIIYLVITVTETSCIFQIYYYLFNDWLLEKLMMNDDTVEMLLSNKYNHYIQRRIGSVSQ